MRTNSSVLRGIGVLELIARSPNGARLSEISRSLGIPSSNTSLFVNSLVESGYVIKSLVDGRYFISDKLERLVSDARGGRLAHLESIAYAEMKKLHDLFDENVLLSVLNGFQVQFVLTLPSSKNVRILNTEDRFLPHVTAGGKAILAYLPSPTLEHYFVETEFEQHTRKSLRSRNGVLRDLERTRSRGFAINRGEHDEVVMAVAAPIFYRDVVSASIVVQFPTFRYKENDLGTYAKSVVASATQVTRQWNLEHQND